MEVNKGNALPRGLSQQIQLNASKNLLMILTKWLLIHISICLFVCFTDSYIDEKEGINGGISDFFSSSAKA